MIADQERGIYSELTQNVFRTLQIDCSFCAPDAHWGNGAAEAAVRELELALDKATASNAKLSFTHRL